MKIHEVTYRTRRSDSDRLCLFFFRSLLFVKPGLLSLGVLAGYLLVFFASYVAVMGFRGANIGAERETLLLEFLLQVN